LRNVSDDRHRNVWEQLLHQTVADAHRWLSEQAGRNLRLRYKHRRASEEAGPARPHTRRHPTTPAGDPAPKVRRAPKVPALAPRLIGSQAARFCHLLSHASPLGRFFAISICLPELGLLTRNLPAFP
jgi:hypothetical protein